MATGETARSEITESRIREPSDAELLRRPIIIVGAPRSGTSFLANIIGQHRSVAMAMEPRFTWRWGNDGKSDLLRPEDARPEVIACIRRRFAAVVREQDKHRLAEKTPSNSLRLPFVDRVFPDCRFVHITRNGVDAVLSTRDFWQENVAGLNPQGDASAPLPLRDSRLFYRIREMRARQLPYYAGELLRRIAPGVFLRLLGPPVLGPRLPGIEQMWKELDLLEVCCLQWRICVELACQSGRPMGAGRYMECRLEELSMELIRSILEFCELDEDPAVTGYLEERFDPTRPGARKENHDPRELETIMTWIEPTLEWLGYR